MSRVRLLGTNLVKVLGILGIYRIEDLWFWFSLGVSLMN